MTTKRTTKAQLQEQLDNQKLRAEIADHKLRRNLSESFFSPAPQFGDLVNPFNQFLDGSQLIYPLYSRRNQDQWLTESMRDLVRMYARYLYQTNLTAQGLVLAQQNYVIKTGYEYVVTGNKDSDDKSPLVRKTQKVVEDFLTKNNWFDRENDLFVRTKRDGESFTRLFPQNDGITRARTVEPEQVRAPEATPRWLFGVLVDEDDKENVLGYHVSYDGTTENGEMVMADKMVQTKINCDLIIRRGLSDFFCSQESLIAVQKLLRASVQGEAVRQAIAYVRQHQQANRASIVSLQTEEKDYDSHRWSQYGDRTQPTRIVTPGSVEDIPQSMEYQDGPQGNGANAAAVLQSVYQSLAANQQVPAWMVSGDTAGVNFASSLTMESPFVRNCERQQKLYGNKYKEVITKVIEIAVDQGELPEDALTEVTVNVVCPPVVVRNAKDETARNLMLAQNGMLSARTWSDREELDYDQEQENNKLDGSVVVMPIKTEQRSVTPDAQYAQQTDRPE